MRWNGPVQDSSAPRKLICCATVMALVLTQAPPSLAASAGEEIASTPLVTVDPTSAAGPTCGAIPPRVARNYTSVERFRLDTTLEELLRQPVRMRVPGQGSTGQTLSSQDVADVDTSARWLPGYRPNTPEAWRELDAWKAEQRRARRDARVAVSTSLAGTAVDDGTGTGSQVAVSRDDDAPVAVVRDELYQATPVDVRDLEDDAGIPDPGHVEGRPRSVDPKTGIPWEEYLRLKEEARFGPETPEAQVAEPRMIDGPSFQGVSFEAIDANGSVPPDPIMTAGPGHLVTIVNQRYRVWDKNGTPMGNEISLPGFFAGLPNCDSPFDPFVDYDEENDRFVMGGMNFGSNGTYLCIAATQTGDPTMLWNRYEFRADELLPSAGIDYPHMAIGLDAIYVGANMFSYSTGQFDSSRIYALDKTAMYGGDPLQVAEFGVSTYRTPQPARIRGFNTGQWPSPGTPHHILTQPDGSGSVRVYRWADPFAPSDPTLYGDVSTTYTGVAPNAPELGDTQISQTKNDTSAGPLLDAEYRDGAVWSARTVFCNIGGGATEACIDWIKLDVSGVSPSLEDQQAGGAFGSVDEFRYYPDLAVDKLGNMAIGYTKSSFSDYTQIWVTGREAGDAAGTLQSEVLQVAGAGNYVDGVGCGYTCDRWGDYTGMAADPDGCTLWYIGEYSDGGEGTGNWKTHVASYKFDSCSVDSSVGSDKGTYNCDDSLEVTVTDATPIDAATVSAQTVVSGMTDSETIPAAQWIGTNCVGSSCGTWAGSLPVSSDPGSSDDGTLNISDGESISIDYTDLHPGHQNQSRQATVSCQTRFDEAGFLINGGCENGSGAEFYRDYIDAGEYVRYTFGIRNPDAAPSLTDVEVTLAVNGPLAGAVTIGNPTVYLGPMGPGLLSGPVFDIHVDPSAAGSGLSSNDFELSITSVADGFIVPQVLTQTQFLQADDNIVGESECLNMETDQGFQSTPYVETYQCLYPPCTGAPISSIAGPWTRGTGCGSETRDDYPGMSCDTNGTWAYTINDSSSSCGTFAQNDFEFTSDLLYTPIIVPAYTGNASNGQPWFHNWIYAEWFFWVDNWVDSIPSISTTQLWTDDYTGVATPGVNDINDFPYWMGNFYGLSPQDWESATPWDPANPPANLDGIFLTGVAGETRAGMQWRWAIWQRDIDATLARSPVATLPNGGVAYDNLNLVYDQYHAEAQTTACTVTEAPGTVSFDQFSYHECSGGVLGVSVFDGNGSDPVTVTVTSDGTQDSETFILSGPAPRWALELPYSMDDGVDPDDGVLFVTPDDILYARYTDDSPAGIVNATTVVECPEQDVIVQGIASIDDTANAGDGDGIPDTNEIVDLSITVRNNGTTSLSNVEATIWTTDPDIDCISKDTASFGTLAPSGGTATNDLVSDPFTFKVANSTECTDPSNPPTVTFNVFIKADTIDGASQPQYFSFDLDIDDLGSTVMLTEDFDGSEPVGWSHQVGPGDDDGIGDPGAAGLDCNPYSDQWFWSSSGGNTGGGFFCWENPADAFPAGTYGDNLDSVLQSTVMTIPASGSGATLTFDHEYKFVDAASTGGGTFGLDGAVVQYSVNAGPWQKVTDLSYNANLFFNTYCNPLCNGGDDLSNADPPSQQDCFHETPNRGERIFNRLGNVTQNWVTVSGDVVGLTAGDELRFRWRVGSMNSATLGFDTTGGYGLDNVAVDAQRLICDTTVRPHQGCGVVFHDAGNFTEVCGNGNGIIETNEQWDVDVTLQNSGEGNAVDTMADLEVNLGSAVGAIVTGNPQSFGTIPEHGGTATATYRFEAAGGAVCINDITFDVTNISDTGEIYPDEGAAFTASVGGVAIGETGIQQTSPAAATSGTASAAFTPEFTQAGAVETATLGYSFNYGDAIASETATQDTDPIEVVNGAVVSTLSAAFTIDDLDATSASVDWTSLTEPGYDVTACTSVSLRTPNATDVTLKALGAADNSPYNVLSTYLGGNGGPGQYSIVLNEKQGGGCNGTGSLSGTTMTVEAVSSGNWVSNARVSLVNGGASTVLKDYGQADSNPYDVTSFYNANGAGTYEIRVEENAGAAAEVSAAVLSVQTYACAGSCTALPAPPPVGDGVSGTLMLASRGAGTDDVDISFDASTCSDDHAVVVYGTMGDFTTYQGEVATGCDAGNTGTASFNQSGSYWFNVIWVNGNNTAGSPGASSDGARTWTASGLCGVASDDPQDQVCN